jgi:hypothetical protein
MMELGRAAAVLGSRRNGCAAIEGDERRRRHALAWQADVPAVGGGGSGGGVAERGGDIQPVTEVDLEVCAGKGHEQTSRCGRSGAHEGGPETDLSELVTYLNDAVLMAPSVLLRGQTRSVTPSSGQTLTQSAAGSRIRRTASYRPLVLHHSRRPRLQRRNVAALHRGQLEGRTDRQLLFRRESGDFEQPVRLLRRGEPPEQRWQRTVPGSHHGTPQREMTGQT